MAKKRSPLRKTLRTLYHVVCLATFVILCIYTMILLVPSLTQTFNQPRSEAKQSRLSKPSPIQLAPQSASLTNGLDLLSEGEFNEAQSQLQLMDKTALDYQILAWALLTANNSAATVSQVESWRAALHDWPIQKSINRYFERALYRERYNVSKVMHSFSRSKPQTLEGSLALAQTLLALDKQDDAISIIGPIWRTRRIYSALERIIIKDFASLLSQDDHCHRMELMLYFDRINSAERVAKLCGKQALFEAFSALTRKQKRAGILLDKVPTAQQGPAYIFAKAQYLRRSGKFLEASDIMDTAPRNVAKLVDPNRWWVERRVLARELLDLKQYKRAYKIAADHVSSVPSKSIDAEFHAGWIAQRFLNDSKKAAVHFAKISAIAENPHSKARGAYWQGRAAQKENPKPARAFFQTAANYGTTFYGQVAAATLKQNSIVLHELKVAPAMAQHFMQRKTVRAIRRITTLGFKSKARRLFMQIAQELETIEELNLLSDLAENLGDHFIALRIGKRAAKRGFETGNLAHPLGAIPNDANISIKQRALAYAIARQESEFNVSAKSPVGALGLMQLMPSTAKQVAKHQGLAFSQPRLTNDVAYNVLLGSNYLQSQLKRFSNSYILTFAAYNAGPRKAREWMKRFGDPRGKSIEEVIDWIERIPYTETRNYVQKVMENLQIYNQLLTAEVTIAKDLRRAK